MWPQVPNLFPMITSDSNNHDTSEFLNLLLFRCKTQNALYSRAIDPAPSTCSIEAEQWQAIRAKSLCPHPVTLVIGRP
jgi:hypothetical protein